MGDNRESEFAGKQFRDTTLPDRRPRPVKRPRDKLRLGYITGDQSGRSPRDGGRAWRGEPKK